MRRITFERALAAPEIPSVHPLASPSRPTIYLTMPARVRPKESFHREIASWQQTARRAGSAPGYRYGAAETRDNFMKLPARNLI